MKKKTNDTENAGFFLRMGAWIYDSLIIAALMTLGAGIPVAIAEAMIEADMMALQNYQDTAELFVQHPIISPIFTGYLAILWVSFFVIFWCRGQTLGMRIWGLGISNEQGGKITITQALIRLFTSAFGLSNLAALVDPDKRGFQDIWAKTRVVVLKKS